MLRSHLWRKLVSMFTSLTLLLALSSVAAAKEPIDAAALADQLNVSKNPAKAYRALTAEEQSAVDNFLAVVSFEEATTSGAVVSASSRPKVDGIVALAATRCWTITKTLNAKNFFGMTMWAYKVRIDWCGDGAKITDVLRKTRWGEVYHAYWSWSHIDLSTSGGAGKTWYSYFTQAEFRYCPVGQGCVNHRYPYIDMTVKPNGVVTGSMGG